MVNKTIKYLVSSGGWISQESIGGKQSGKTRGSNLQCFRLRKTPLGSIFQRQKGLLYCSEILHPPKALLAGSLWKAANIFF